MTTHAVLGLTISVGNAATQDPADVAAILRAVADRLEATTYADVERRSIAAWDYNGNRVGSLQVTGFSTSSDDDDD